MRTHVYPDTLRTNAVAASGALITAAPARAALRSAIVVSSHRSLRQAVVHELHTSRWSAREAAGAAEMFAMLERQPAAMVLIDSWLPDLEVRECVVDLQRLMPELDVLALDGSDLGAATPRSLFRGELLHALRRAQATVGARENDAEHEAGAKAPLLVPRCSTDGPAWESSLPAQEILRRHSASLPENSRTQTCLGFASEVEPGDGVCVGNSVGGVREVASGSHARLGNAAWIDAVSERPSLAAVQSAVLPAGEPGRRAQQTGLLENGAGPAKAVEALPEFVGSDEAMLEVSRRIRLVAHRRTTVLVHGETGTGKELVARALHRLSGRPAARFVAINCAAIPEALVEAELFGYAKGAFTGASQSRVGRIEAAAGGTLFLDEVGELPLTVQSKLLRFLESGEIQRVGENDTVQVDARVVAATHRKLGAMAAEGEFRLDLLHRLSVFLIRTPALAGRAAEIDHLLEHFLNELSKSEAAKALSPSARIKLLHHSWPGNIRELKHALERAWILAGENPVIDEGCIDFGEALL